MLHWSLCRLRDDTKTLLSRFLSVAKCRGSSWVVGRAWVVGVGVGRGQKKSFSNKKLN